MSTSLTQEQELTLIEQAIKELTGQCEVTAVQVQAWLLQHDVDLSIEQINGDMKIMLETIDGEWE